MKKFLFSFALLAFAGSFSFCTKESVSPAATTSQNDNQVTIGATDRGGPCDVTITATDKVMVMGLANNLTPGIICSSGQSVTGVDIGTGPFNYTVTPAYPATPFSIRNLANQAVVVTIVTSATTGVWTIPQGECLTIGLATTCLFISQ